MEEERNPEMSTQMGDFVNLRHVHGKQMLLCWFVFGCAAAAADALSHHQHEALFAAAKHHQALVGVSNQQFLNTIITSS